MDLLHKIVLGFEIYAIAAAGLVVLSLALATIRALFGKTQPAFSYPVDVPKAEAKAAAEPYWHRALVALDVFLNVVVMFGNQGETMSSHAWRASMQGKLWGKLMNAWLNGFQSKHGPQAASGDLERASVMVSLLRKLLGV
jgi:hypothetical protein